jgi:hypothetical protein
MRETLMLIMPCGGSAVPGKNPTPECWHIELRKEKNWGSLRCAPGRKARQRKFVFVPGRFFAIEPLNLLHELVGSPGDFNPAVFCWSSSLMLSLHLLGQIEGRPDLLRVHLGFLPASRLRADLPRRAVRINVQILGATALSPVRIAFVGTLSLVARVDRHSPAGAVARNGRNKCCVLADLHFRHFNPSHFSAAH